MVLELKIECFGMDQPAVRQVKIGKRTSFRQLHYIIQALFDWSDIHPHLFILHHPKRSTAIGNREWLRHPFLEPYRQWQILDERYQKASTWLKKEGDAFIYEYYHNEQKFSHLIEFIKYSEDESTALYPQVTHAEYLTPLDQRFPRENHKTAQLNAENITDLRHHLNQQLMKEETIIKEPNNEVYDYYENLLEWLIEDYLTHQPWINIGEDQIISIVDPESGIKLFVSIIGQDGREPGFTICVGEESFLEIQKGAFQQNKTGISFDPHWDLESFNGIIFLLKEEFSLGRQKSDNFNPENAKAILYSFASEKKQPRYLEIDEMRWVILVFEQIQIIHTLVKKGLEIPFKSESLSILERIYSPVYHQFVNHEIRIVLE